MNLESHRLKAASYRKNHDDERKTFESHCKQVILDCHRRQFAVKLNVKTVQQVLVNEAEKFTFDWLKKIQFTHKYAERFLLENELVFTEIRGDARGEETLDPRRRSRLKYRGRNSS